MGEMKRIHFDNIVQLFPPKVATTAADWWMGWHADWWETKGQKLDWQPIATYEVLTPSMALATPMILRSGERWVYGSKIDGIWHRVTERASYPLDDFEPTHWADVDLDAAIMLGQE